MNRSLFSEGDTNHIQKYNGIPNENKPTELGLWRKFLAIFFPYMKAKWNQLERLAEAEVSLKEAEAASKWADTAEKVQKVKAIAKAAAEREQQKMQEIDTKIFSENEIKEKLEELQQKLSCLQVVNGARIEVVINSSSIEENVINGKLQGLQDRLNVILEEIDTIDSRLNAKLSKDQ